MNNKFVTKKEFEKFKSDLMNEIKQTVSLAFKDVTYSKDDGIVQEKNPTDEAQDFQIEKGILIKYNGTLKEVTIPNYVKIIGRGAFEKSEIERVIIPDSVTSISNSAFWDCKSLTSISIPNGVTSIGNSAFSYCKGLTSITIPDSVTSIGDGAFRGCSITKATIPTIAISYIRNSNLKEVVITSGENILPSAFENCSKLRSIVIADSVTSIGKYAFEGCPIKTASIPAMAGSYIKNPKLKAVIITSGDTIDSYALSFCSSLTSVTIGNGVTSIGNSAFEGCDSLTTISIPDSVTSIGKSAFDYCSITKATIPTIAISCIKNSNLKEVVITSGEKIPAYAFSFCDSLASVTIGNGVTSIGDSAFSYCKSLTSVTIGDGVTSIGDSAFYDCPITKATTPTVAISYIKNSNLKEAVITSGKNIPAYAFSNCSKLTRIEISDSVTSIGDDAFDGCSITKATIPTMAISYIKNPKLKEVVITSGENIPACAFSSCENLTTISIPDNVTSIGYLAFYGCSITKATIPTQAIPYINNSNLKEVVITSGKNIPKSAFKDCSSLTSITIPNSVTSIGDDAFHGCKSLTSITFLDVSTWYRTDNPTKWKNKRGGTETNLAISTFNAIYFTTNSHYYWYKL